MISWIYIKPWETTFFSAHRKDEWYCICSLTYIIWLYTWWHTTSKHIFILVKDRNTSLILSVMSTTSSVSEATIHRRGAWYHFTLRVQSHLQMLADWGCLLKWCTFGQCRMWHTDISQFAVFLRDQLHWSLLFVSSPICFSKQDVTIHQ